VPPPSGSRPGRATIDRFEEDVAVLVVDGREELLPRDALPAGAREGDVVDLATGALDRESTERLREEVRAARAAASGGGEPEGGSFDL
jgi:hypothetical protein